MESIKRPSSSLQEHVDHVSKKQATILDKVKEKRPVSLGSKIEDTLHLSDKDRSQLSKAIDGKIPFLFGVRKEDEKVFSADKIVTTNQMIRDYEDLDDLNHSKSYKLPGEKKDDRQTDISLFMIKEESKPPERIGTIADICKLDRFRKSHVISLLTINNPSFSESTTQIADVAAIFQSGTFVKKDQSLAQRVLNTLGSQEDIKEALTDAVFFSCDDDEKFFITKAFLELGADPNGEDERNYIAAQSAVNNGSYKTAKLLIDFGAIVGTPVGIYSHTLLDVIKMRAAFDPVGVRKAGLLETANFRVLEEERIRLLSTPK